MRKSSYSSPDDIKFVLGSSNPENKHLWKVREMTGPVQINNFVEFNPVLKVDDYDPRDGEHFYNTGRKNYLNFSLGITSKTGLETEMIFVFSSLIVMKNGSLLHYHTDLSTREVRLSGEPVLLLDLNFDQQILCKKDVNYLEIKLVGIKFKITCGCVCAHCDQLKEIFSTHVLPKCKKCRKRSRICDLCVNFLLRIEWCKCDCVTRIADGRRLRRLDAVCERSDDTRIEIEIGI